MTKHGVICLPDTCGWGPIYACTLVKRHHLKHVGISALIHTSTSLTEGNEDDGDEDVNDEDEDDDR